jgi:succinyl-diaminopimelate desuccinylase
MDTPQLIDFARALIRRPSVTPADEGALGLVEEALKSLGFSTSRLAFAAEGAATVDNLYAKWGEGRPVFAYAGHTDVVPTGPTARWRHPPFSAEIEDGVLWGRGSADMKSGIAAFIAAAERTILKGAVRGTLCLLITGDEEGPAINGTKKMLDWMRSKGERIDHCLVGEPTSSAVLGDMVKVGRRGSMNCVLTVRGRQGHVGYPDRANNPVHAIVSVLSALIEPPLDAGYDQFQPSGLQVTDIHVGNHAPNVIPAEAEAKFNIRFNPHWTAATLEAELRARIAPAIFARGAEFDLKCVCSGEAFLTRDEGFLAILDAAIEAETGRRPERSTTGGTSDARFIKDIAPVAEFGLVGRTIHQIDEHVAVDDIERLARIYEGILTRYFAAAQ